VGVRGDLVTWIFEPESFAPIAKLTGTDQHSIITDHLGTPTAMLDQSGKTLWSADISIYGELRNVVGEKQACPFRWPGQYEDAETGLYYNRFRYYDPDAGEYVSQDPIGLAGQNPTLYGYVSQPTSQYDPFGLASCSKRPPSKRSFWSGGDKAREAAEKWAKDHGGTTLGQTARGRTVARVTSGKDWDTVARPAWERASDRFARGAKGEVHVFATREALADPTRILNTHEIPALTRPGSGVTDIIYHIID
jgi:RHS repeat-associated protein